MHRGFCINDDKGFMETRQGQRGITARRYREITQAAGSDRGPYQSNREHTISRTRTNLLIRCGAQPHALIYQASNSFALAFNKIALSQGQKKGGTTVDLKRSDVMIVVWRWWLLWLYDKSILVAKEPGGSKCRSVRTTHTPDSARILFTDWFMRWLQAFIRVEQDVPILKRF